MRSWFVPVALTSLLACAGPSRERGGSPVPSDVTSLQQVVDRAVSATLEANAKKGFTAESLAISLIDLTPGREHQRAGFREDVRIYPASVVKLFYLVAAHRWAEDRKLELTPAVEGALRDMIVDSSNDATALVVDLLTGTTSGPELPEPEMAIWAEKRRAVQRYFEGLGYQDINVVQKTWGDGPYGRERAYYGVDFTNRNMLTTRATARLLTEIVQGHAVNAWRSGQMRALLERNPAAKTDDPDDQATGFAARGLPAGSKLWSKAGWMSRVRHDAAYVELPSGQQFVLVVFTEGKAFAKDRELLGRVVREIVTGMERLK